MNPRNSFFYLLKYLQSEKKTYSMNINKIVDYSAK